MRIRRWTTSRFGLKQSSVCGPSIQIYVKSGLRTHGRGGFPELMLTECSLPPSDTRPTSPRWVRTRPVVSDAGELLGVTRTTSGPERVKFRALSEATPQDWTIIDRAEREYRRQYGPGHGLLKILASIADGDPMGAPVNLYAHSLQTATRVLKAGGDDELVMIALFHDLPEAFTDNDHGLVAAQILAPWISEALQLAANPPCGGSELPLRQSPHPRSERAGSVLGSPVPLRRLRSSARFTIRIRSIRSIGSCRVGI